MIQKMIQARRNTFFLWVDKRLTSRKSYRLSQRNLFIFPTSRGLMFLSIVAVLWVLGTNYQNNLILALAFFMISLFWVAILNTYYNLRGLELEYLGCSEVFAGEELRFRFKIKNTRKHWAESMRFRWQNESTDTGASVSSFSEKEISLPLYVTRRGAVTFPRMRVESVYPIGIIRSWTWLNWDAQTIAYPKPLNAPLGYGDVVDEEGDGLHPVSGGEDFNGLREYVAGDSLKHIAWKAFARGQGLFSKDFNQNLSKENWLDYAAIAASSPEEKLSILCFWVLDFYQKNESFGLILPTETIPPNTGYEHRTACLQALARF